MLLERDLPRMLRIVRSRFRDEQNRSASERMGWLRIMEKVVEEEGYRYPESQIILSELSTLHARAVRERRERERTPTP